MKKLISVIFAFILFTTMSPVNAFAGGSDILYNDETGMPDKILYEAVLTALGREGGYFTRDEAAGITELKSNNYKKAGIKSLKGIENLTGLTELDVSCNELTSLSGIEGLTKLKVLYVSYNNLISLSGIKGLTRLEYLEAGDNQINSLKEIEELTSLKALFVYRNKLVNLKGVERLTKLNTFYVYENELNDITGIERLKKLTALSLSGNRLTSVKGIENLKNLGHLHISQNKLKSLPDLRKLKYLDWENTDFGGNKLTVKTLVTKSPSHLVKDNGWLKLQIENQKVVETVKCKKPKSFKKITVNTRKIVGKARKRMFVRLKAGGKTLQTVKTDSKGIFRFKKLNLKKFGGKKLKLQVFYYNKKYNITWVLKTVKITVKKC